MLEEAFGVDDLKVYCPGAYGQLDESYNPGNRSVGFYHTQSNSWVIHGTAADNLLLHLDYLSRSGGNSGVWVMNNK